MNLVWSEQARNSLAKIYDYIYQDSPRSAEKVLETLLKKSESLKDSRVEHPIDPVLNNPKYRYILQWNFKIVYKRTDNEVLILDIFHTSRDPGNLIL